MSACGTKMTLTPLYSTGVLAQCFSTWDCLVTYTVEPTFTLSLPTSTLRGTNALFWLAVLKKVPEVSTPELGKGSVPTESFIVLPAIFLLLSYYGYVRI